jgi:hypothetical protein
MNTIEGFYILTGGDKKEKLAYHCSRCSVDYIIGDGCAPRVYCCGQWKEHKPEQPTGLRAFFASEDPLPRVRFKERPIRRLQKW